MDTLRGKNGFDVPNRDRCAIRSGLAPSGGRLSCTKPRQRLVLALWASILKHLTHVQSDELPSSALELDIFEADAIALQKWIAEFRSRASYLAH